MPNISVDVTFFEEDCPEFVQALGEMTRYERGRTIRALVRDGLLARQREAPLFDKKEGNKTIHLITGEGKKSRAVKGGSQEKKKRSWVQVEPDENANLHLEGIQGIEDIENFSMSLTA